MAKILILRDKDRAAAWLKSRAALALAVFAAISSCVMPLAASRPAASSLTVALPEPTPMSGPEDLASALGIAPDGQFQNAVVTGSYPAAYPDAAFPNTADGTLLTPEELVPYVPQQQYYAGPAATPYVFRGRTATDNLRALMCLTAAIYYEAANEPDNGQRAVAQVVLNRVRHPAFPNTVCDVVYQGTERNDTLCQFTFGCDGALARRPAAAQWARARRVAAEALAGSVFAPVGMATNYHTLAVSPSWGRRLSPVGIFGAHIFYKMPGGIGEPRSFRAAYTGREPFPGPRPKLNPPPAPPMIMANANTPLPVGTPYVQPGAVVAPPPGALAAQVVPPPAAPSVAPIVPNRTVAADKRYLPGALPESDVNPAYQNSGQWIARP
jgi:spore germination cell wall hydrolase CwlJ-like protein